jgi:diacylglycerol O-acyltransferase / wax synthase
MNGTRPMGAVDSVWLTMDRPDNLMVIDSLLWFDAPVDWERLAAVIQRRLVDRYPVFSQLALPPAHPLGPPRWGDDPDFAIDAHVVRAALPQPGDDAQLERYVESQMHVPLDRSRPLWEIHFIDGYRDGAAVMTRFHHALADGIALAHVLLSLTDAQATDDLAELESAQDDADTGTASGIASSLSSTAGSAVRGAGHLLNSLPRTLTPAAVAELVTVALQTGYIADKLLLGSNPDSPLRGPIGVPKRAVWSQPRSLAEVKRVGRLAGATVNDVLVSAVSGAIGTYLIDHGGDALDLTTMVPVNLRPLGQPLPRELGNQFALVMLPLPTGLLAPLQRLSESKRRMDSIKHSPEAMLTFGIINAIGRTNPDVARLMVNFFAAKAIGVTTNVVGPLVGRYIAGTRIAGLLGWVPGSGQQTVGVCIISYDQTVRVGFKVDAGVVADPEKLVHAFDDEMDVLARIAEAS